MSYLRFIAFTVLIASLLPVVAEACESQLQADQAFLRGETLHYRVETVKIAGIGGLVKASGNLTLALTPGAGGASGVLSGTANAKAPLMKAYSIDLRMATALDTAHIHSRGFEQTVRWNSCSP